MSLHYQDEEIIIYKIVCGPYDNNAYLVVNPWSNESLIIDAPANPERLIQIAEQTNVKAILITHNHVDHIQGLTDIMSMFDVKVGIGVGDDEAVKSDLKFTINHGDEINIGSIVLKALLTPGHTPGSTCFLVGKHLFSGDTLFPSGPGRSDSPEKLGQLLDSISTNLFVLGSHTIFYPGHGEDGDIQTSLQEYDVFKSKQHPYGLCGDVRWLDD